MTRSPDVLLDPALRPVIAHRGSSGTHPENTLLAFDQAVAEGADALEFDVRVTQDGVPVVMHDPTVDRTTNGSGPVAGLTLEAIRRLDAGGGERVPTLDEVLARHPAMPLLIEIKDPAASDPALSVLRRHAAAGRVVVGSFRGRALVPFRRAGLATSPARAAVLRAWAASRVGLSWPSGEAFAVPEWRGGLHVVDERFVRAAARRGRPVHVWTVDRPAEARRLRHVGVCGIITNYPQRMLDL